METAVEVQAQCVTGRKGRRRYLKRMIRSYLPRRQHTPANRLRQLTLADRRLLTSSLIMTDLLPQIFYKNIASPSRHLPFRRPVLTTV